MRQPLTALAAYGKACEIMIRQGKSDAALQDVIGRIGAECRRATDVLHRLRDFFRSGSTRLEKVDLAMLVADVEQRLASRLHDAKVDCTLTVPVGLEVLADRLQIEVVLRNLLAKPLYEAAGLTLPKAAAETMEVAKEVLPTLRPIGELGPYAGEVILGLREGHDVFLNVAPTGCMVSTMGQVFAPRLRAAAAGEGRIQHLFSADGEVNAETLALAMLKRLGPEGFFVHSPMEART
jgi:hypothetical protein